MRPVRGDCRVALLEALRKQAPEPIKALADVSLGRIAKAAACTRANRGEPSRYGIFAGYVHRAEPCYFDDTGFADEWQREVYAFAAALMARECLASVADVGCGSGYKLVNYLGNYDTTGYDVEKTVAFLKAKYPERTWCSVPFSERGLPSPDLVVCSDVIEHVPDPDALLDFIIGLAPRYVVLSTPDRDCLYRPGSRHHFGPPTNPTHLREWSFAELRAYIGGKLDVLEHRITNRAQGTQMIFARPRR